jgi:hypothetical protein
MVESWVEFGMSTDLVVFVLDLMEPNWLQHEVLSDH